MPITKYFINKNIDNQTETLYWHFQLNHISKPLRIRAQVSLYKGAQDIKYISNRSYRFQNSVMYHPTDAQS